MPSLVADDQLPRANSLMASGQIVANEFIGPPPGAALFVMGAAVPVAADAGTLAIAGALLLTLPRTISGPHQPAVVEAPRDALRAGFRLVWGSVALRRLVVASAILALVDAAWFALLALFVLDVLGMGPAAFGGLLAVGAVGGLLGSLLADVLARRGAATGRQLVGALVLSAVAQVVLGLSGSVIVVGVMLALSSGAFAVYNVASVTVRQRVATRGTLGRITTITRTAVLSGAVVGAAVGGVLAEMAGLRAPMLALAPLLLIAALVARGVHVDERR